MSEVSDYRRSIERSRNVLKTITSRGTFELRHREWDMLPGVFSPLCSPTTGVAMDLLGLGGETLVPRTGSFLEIGCGAGLIAVSAALAGCNRVVAADISREALQNTALNVGRHGVGDRVRVVGSDLFDGLDPDERFDTIFWSSNYVLGPDDYRYESMHERAYVDAGYRTHRRFLAEATDRLAPGGSVILFFSSRGDMPQLMRLAGEHGLGLRTLRSASLREGSCVVEQMLVEIVRLPTRVAVVDPVPRRHARALAS